MPKQKIQKLVSSIWQHSLSACLQRALQNRLEKLDSIMEVEWNSAAFQIANLLSKEKIAQNTWSELSFARKQELLDKTSFGFGHFSADIAKAARKWREQRFPN